MTRVLIVDDEPAVRAALDRALRLDGYEIELAADGREALDRLADARQDAVILDVAMPGIDGLEVCRRLRDAGDRTPVLMLTARDAVDDRVAGLDAGADDYLVKPFALKELKARLRALLRRAEPPEPTRTARCCGSPTWRWIARRWEARRGPRVLELSRTEFQLLALFLEHPRQVLTRSQIFERVWGYDFGSSSNSLGVYMGYLRRKTEEGGEPRLLHTVRGRGLRLEGLMRSLPLRRRMTIAVAVSRGGRRGAGRGRRVLRGARRAALRGRPRAARTSLGRLPPAAAPRRRPAALPAAARAPRRADAVHPGDRRRRAASR